MRVCFCTPKGCIFDAEADFVSAPAVLGEVGILPKHTPFFTSLRSGNVRIKESGKTHTIYVNGGFLQVAENALFIIAEEAKKEE